MHTLRSPQAKYGRMGLVLMAAVALGLVAVMAVDSQRPLSPSSAPPAQVASPLAMQPSTSEEGVVAKTIIEPPHLFGEEVASLTEAQGRVRFKVLAPSAVPAGYRLTRIGVSPRTAVVNLEYLNGERKFTISQRADGTALGSADEVVRQWPGFEKVDVNGCAGVGHEKGGQTVRGVTSSVPASVMWWCDGVIRTILSYDLSLAEVQAIAESMQ